VWRTLVIVSLLGCLARSDLSTAEEVDGGVPQSEWGTERVLGGHIFAYPTFADTVFLASTLSFQVLATFNATRATAFDSSGTVSVQQISPLLNLGLTLHVADPVSISLGLTGGLSAGISADALVLKGEALSYALTPGIIVRLLRDEKSATQIAVRAGGLFASGTVVNFRGFAEILQGNSGITLGDIIASSLGEILLTPFDSYGGNIGGGLAHAFNRWLALQTSLSLRLVGVNSNPYNIAARQRQGDTQTVLTPSVAAALGFDGNSFKVPLSIMFEYRLGLSWSFDSSTTTTWANGFDLGLFYSGRTDFQAGVIFVAFIGAPPLGVLGPPSTGETQHGFGSVLTMRYVW
jgi:hypothetical protein